MYLGAIPLVDMPICIVRLSKHAQIALRGNSTPQPALKNVQARISGPKKLRSSARKEFFKYLPRADMGPITVVDRIQSFEGWLVPVFPDSVNAPGRLLPMLASFCINAQG